MPAAHCATGTPCHPDSGRICHRHSQLIFTQLLRACSQVFDSQSSDGNAVVQQQLLGPRASKVLYAKHISKHKIGLHPQIWKRAQHMVRACCLPQQHAAACLG